MPELRRGQPRGSLRTRRALSPGREGSDTARTPPANAQGVPKKGDAGSRGALDADIIIANAPDPVFVSDLQGRILQANEAKIGRAHV